MAAPLSLRAEFDRAAALTLTVELGAGWARVALRTPPQPDWAAVAGGVLVAAVLMLDAAGRAPRAAALALAAGGPDPPPAFELGELRGAWEAALAAVPALAGAGPRAPPPANGPPAPPRSPPEPAPARPYSPPEAPAPRPYSPPGAPAPRPPSPGAAGDSDDEELAEVVAAVQAHVRARGGAPSFRGAKATEREKAYNFIRSVAARQRAPADLLERARRRLALDEPRGAGHPGAPARAEEKPGHPGRRGRGGRGAGAAPAPACPPPSPYTGDGAGAPPPAFPPAGAPPAAALPPPAFPRAPDAPPAPPDWGGPELF